MTEDGLFFPRYAHSERLTLLTVFLFPMFAFSSVFIVSFSVALNEFFSLLSQTSYLIEDKQILDWSSCLEPKLQQKGK